VFLLGDYNRNGKVDSPDYTVWRNMLGDEGDDLLADGNGDHKIDRLDFNIWKSHYGQPFGSGSGAKIPEPATVMLLITAIVTLGARRQLS
jgi:hypothetical protein